MLNCRLFLLPLLFLASTCCFREAAAWGQTSSVHSLADSLSMLKALADDFGNGQPIIPPAEFFHLGAGLLMHHHLPNGLYDAHEQPEPPVCNGVGSNNYSTEPAKLDMTNNGASLNYTYALSTEYLRQAQQRPRNPPNVNASEIFDRLFLRKGPMLEDKHGVNFLWVAWINFYFEDFLRTKPNTRGSTRLDESTAKANLATVYGRDATRESILRSYQGGKMRTSINPHTNEEIALLWSDVEEDHPTPNGTTWSYHFVLGDDALNGHWGHIFWHTVFVLEHNRVCDKLAAAHPSFDDDRLFRMARVIMTHRQMRVVTENLASEVVLKRHGVNARFPAAIEFCRDDKYTDLRNLPVDLPIEFLHSYVFHDTVPDVIEYTAGKKSMAFDIFRQPEGYVNASLQEHMDAFYRTPKGAFGPFNIPYFLKFATLKQLEDSRQNGVPSYVDYVKYYSGVDIQSFDDLVHSDEAIAALQEIYPTVQDIDMYVGMLTERRNKRKYPNTIFVKSSLILKYLVRNLLTTSCYKDPYLYTEEFLTKEGYELIEGPHDALSGLLEHHVQLHDQTPFYREGFAEPKFTYQEPRSMTEFRLQNLADFVGLNELWFAFLTVNISEYQYLFVAILIAAMLYVALITVAGPSIKRYIRRLQVAAASELKKTDGKRTTIIDNKKAAADGLGALACHYFVMFAVLVVQAPVYTVIMIFVYFSERPDLAFQTFWFAGWFMPSIHLVLYIADIAVRYRVPWFLAAHHLFWLLFFVMAPLYRDIFTMKVGLTLDYFVCWESGLYWLLFWAKANNRQFGKKARFWGRVAVWVYGVSRLFQLPILIALFVKGYPRMKEFGSIGLYVFALLLTIGVQISQIHVLLLFLGWEPLFGEEENTEELSEEDRRSSSPSAQGSSRRSSVFSVRKSSTWAAHCSKRFSKLLEDDLEEEMQLLSAEDAIIDTGSSSDELSSHEHVVDKQGGDDPKAVDVSQARPPQAAGAVTFAHDDASP